MCALEWQAPNGANVPAAFSDTGFVQHDVIPMPTLTSHALRGCLPERKKHLLVGLALLQTPACVPWPFENKEFVEAVEGSSRSDEGDSGVARRDAGRISTHSTGHTADTSAAADGQPGPETGPNGGADGGESTDDGTARAAGQGADRSTSAMSGGGEPGGAAGGTGGSGVSGSANSPELNPDNVCAQSICDPDYPCKKLDSGYTCRGQFADWSPTYDPSIFEVNVHDETVTDSRSGLVWERCVSLNADCPSGPPGGMAVEARSWDDAKTYCAGLQLAGAGWRLPTKAELESLVDDSHVTPAIDSTAFPGEELIARIFWSSSAFPPGGPDVWCVDFNTGRSSSAHTSDKLAVRCVR